MDISNLHTSNEIKLNFSITPPRVVHNKQTRNLLSGSHPHIVHSGLVFRAYNVQLQYSEVQRRLYKLNNAFS